MNNMNQIKKHLIACSVLCTYLSGCVYYPPLLPPVRSPNFYDHRASKDGLTLAAHPYLGEAETRFAFGADLSKARVLPLELLLFNDTQSDFDISNVSARLTDAKGHELPLLNPEEANKKAKKYAGKRLGAWTMAGTLMIFFTLPAKFRGDEGKPMHSDPIRALRESKTAVLEAGGKPITLAAGENVRWFNYYDISTYGKGLSKDLLREDIFLELTGARDTKTGEERTFTILIPFSES